MSYETEFMKEFEEWIKTQVMINEMALEESKKAVWNYLMLVSDQIKDYRQ